MFSLRFLGNVAVGEQVFVFAACDDDNDGAPADDEQDDEEVGEKSAWPEGKFG